jgi:hypothetical protein
MEACAKSPEARESSEQWDLPDTAGFIAAALTKTANKCDWPDGLRGPAAQLVIQDLGEFAQTMVACGRANFWSPAKALERLFIERTEVLLGVVADERVAKRYLETVAIPAADPQDVKPAKRARAEDAFDVHIRSLGLRANEVESYRRSWQQMKDIASDWFVHPTAMGPLRSRAIRTGEDDALGEWVRLIELMANACAYALVAAHRLEVTLQPEPVQAMYVAGECLKQSGSPNGAVFLEIHARIAGNLAVRRSNE